MKITERANTYRSLALDYIVSDAADECSMFMSCALDLKSASEDLERAALELEKLRAEIASMKVCAL